MPLHVLSGAEKPTVTTVSVAPLSCVYRWERSQKYEYNCAGKSTGSNCSWHRSQPVPRPKTDNSEILYFSINIQQYFCAAFSQLWVMMTATEHAQTLDNVKFQPTCKSTGKDSSTEASAYSFPLYKSNIVNIWK